MRIAVIGAGAMGRWAVKELGLSPDVDEVVVADFNEPVPACSCPSRSCPARPSSPSSRAGEPTVDAQMRELLAAPD